MQKFKLPTSYGYVVTRIVTEHPDCLAAIIKVVDTRVTPPQTRYARVFVTLPNIRREVATGFRKAGLTDRVAGLDWSKLRKMARGAARRVGTDRLMTVVRKVATEADKYGSAIYPPLGVTYNAIKKAHALVKKAEAGSPAAESILRAIKVGAEKGNLAYQKSAKLVVTLHEASKKFDVDRWLADRVSGWGTSYGRVDTRYVAPSRGTSFYRAGLR